MAWKQARWPPLFITFLTSPCTVMTPYQVSSEIYGGFFYSGITLTGPVITGSFDKRAPVPKSIKILVCDWAHQSLALFVLLSWLLIWRSSPANCSIACSPNLACPRDRTNCPWVSEDECAVAQILALIQTVGCTPCAIYQTFNSPAGRGRQLVFPSL